MGWELTISGDATILSWLVRSTAGTSPRILALGEVHRLDWDGLEKLGAEQHIHVEPTALNHLDLLMGLATVLLCRNAEVSLIGVDFRRPDGGRIRFCFMRDTIMVRATADAELTVLDAHGKPKPSQQIEPIAKLRELVSVDQTAAKVVRLARGDLSDWAALYRLYELLEHAAGGPKKLAEIGGVPCVQLSVFSRTANSPALSGDASRHGVQKGTPPSKAMTLPEAVQLLRQLSRAWLLARASE